MRENKKGFLKITGKRENLEIREKEMNRRKSVISKILF